jgi:CMP-N,N'-diacetyllegionaminic acid synthase
MTKPLKTLGLITARGGSKGVPKKNLRSLNGRTLIERTVTAAREAAFLNRVVLSSEDAEIIAAAITLGCEVPFIRPGHLSTDAAKSIDVVRHALVTLDEVFDLIVVLQPTSPLRAPEDIDGAVRLCIESGAPACVSVVDAEKPPYWIYTLDSASRLGTVLPDGANRTRRQDLPETFAINGAVYVARSEWIMNSDSFVGPDTVGYVMPKERSVDIDSEIDLVVAEAMERYITLRDAATPVEDRETASR